LNDDCLDQFLFHLRDAVTNARREITLNPGCEAQNKESEKLSLGGSVSGR